MPAPPIGHFIQCRCDRHANVPTSCSASMVVMCLHMVPPCAQSPLSAMLRGLVDQCMVCYWDYFLSKMMVVESLAKQEEREPGAASW